MHKVCIFFVYCVYVHFLCAANKMSSEVKNHLVRITGDVISQEEITKFVTDPTAGGISIFLGML